MSNLLKWMDAVKEQKFTEMVKKHSSELLGYAHWIKGELEAEDLLQKTWLKAWRNYDKIKDVKSEIAWLKFMMKRLSLHQFERMESKMVFIPLDEQERDLYFNVDFTDAIFLEQMFDRASPKAAEAGRQRVQEELTNVEIHRMYGTNPITVATRYMRFVKYCQENLQ